MHMSITMYTAALHEHMHEPYMHVIQQGYTYQHMNT